MSRDSRPARAVSALMAALLASLITAGCAAPDDRPSLRERERPAQEEPGRTKKPDTGSTSAPTGPSGNTGIQRLAKGPVSTGWRITRVVDGDTVDATRGRRTLTLRLIGIDTPETVHPTEPIECFGPQATAFASRRLLGEQVALEFDPSQGRLDYYDRTLAYVWTTSGTPRQFNRAAVRGGYALEYTYDDAYLWQREFLRAQAAAVAQRLGVWRCPRPGS
jgi:micrococcal nuclease